MKRKKAVVAGAILTVFGVSGAFAGNFGANILPELPAASIPLSLPSALPAAPARLPVSLPAMRVQLQPAVELGRLEHHLSKKAAVQPALDRFFDNVAGIPVPAPLPVGRL